MEQLHSDSTNAAANCKLCMLIQDGMLYDNAFAADNNETGCSVAAIKAYFYCADGLKEDIHDNCKLFK